MASIRSSSEGRLTHKGMHIKNLANSRLQDSKSVHRLVCIINIEELPVDDYADQKPVIALCSLLILSHVVTISHPMVYLKNLWCQRS